MSTPDSRHQQQEDKDDDLEFQDWQRRATQEMDRQLRLLARQPNDEDVWIRWDADAIILWTLHPHLRKQFLQAYQQYNITKISFDFHVLDATLTKYKSRIVSVEPVETCLREIAVGLGALPHLQRLYIGRGLFSTRIPLVTIILDHCHQLKQILLGFGGGGTDDSHTTTYRIDEICQRLQSRSALQELYCFTVSKTALLSIVSVLPTLDNLTTVSVIGAVDNDYQPRLALAGAQDAALLETILTAARLIKLELYNIALLDDTTANALASGLAYPTQTLQQLVLADVTLPIESASMVVDSILQSPALQTLTYSCVDKKGSLYRPLCLGLSATKCNIKSLVLGDPNDDYLSNDYFVSLLHNDCRNWTLESLTVHIKDWSLEWEQLLVSWIQQQQGSNHHLKRLVLCLSEDFDGPSRAPPNLWHALQLKTNLLEFRVEQVGRGNITEWWCREVYEES